MFSAGHNSDRSKAPDARSPSREAGVPASSFLANFVAANSNRQFFVLLEFVLTRTKQSLETNSNRHFWEGPAPLPAVSAPPGRAPNSSTLTNESIPTRYTKIVEFPLTHPKQMAAFISTTYKSTLFATAHRLALTPYPVSPTMKFGPRNMGGSAESAATATQSRFVSPLAAHFRFRFSRDRQGH